MKGEMFIFYKKKNRLRGLFQKGKCFFVVHGLWHFQKEGAKIIHKKVITDWVRLG